MAITIKGRPDNFTPAFNPMYFYMDSNQKNQEAFKYVVDIYSAGTADLLASYKLFPRPNDGYGVADINQIIRSNISEDLNPIPTGGRHIPNIYVNYDVEFGEEYIVTWDWFDTIFENTSGLTIVYSTGSTTPFVTGDFIELQQNAGFDVPAYNGVFEVLSAVTVSGFSGVIINQNFIAGATVGGTSFYEGKPKSIFIDNSKNIFDFRAWNGAIGHQQFMQFNPTNYNTVVNNNALFLTNVPNGYRVRESNTMRLNFYSSSIVTSANTGSTSYSIQLLTNHGQYNLPLSGIGYVNVIDAGPGDITINEENWINDFGIFPIFRNYCWQATLIQDDGTGLTLFSGATPSPWASLSDAEFVDEVINFVGNNGQIFKINGDSIPDANSVILQQAFADMTATSGILSQTTDNYSIQLYSGVTAESSAYTFNVDWSQTRYGNIELVFIDRLGSYVPANFTLQNVRSENINRDSYNQILGNLGNIDGSIKWQYNSWERGKKNINTTVTQQLELTSDWLTEAEAYYLRELYSSPSVFIKDFGQLWPVNVISNNYQIQTKNNKKNIQIKIVIEYSNNNIINNV